MAPSALADCNSTKSSKCTYIARIPFPVTFCVDSGNGGNFTAIGDPLQGEGIGYTTGGHCGHYNVNINDVSRIGNLAKTFKWIGKGMIKSGEACGEFVVGQECEEP